MHFPGAMGFQKRLRFLFRVCRAVVLQGKLLPAIRSLQTNYRKRVFRKITPLPWPTASAYWGEQPGTARSRLPRCGDLFFVYPGNGLCKELAQMVDSFHMRCGYCPGLGKASGFLNYFLFDYLPFYSKFRAPSMALVMPQLGFALLAVSDYRNSSSPTGNREIGSQENLKQFYTYPGGLAAGQYYHFLHE